MCNGYIIFKEGRRNIPKPAGAISYFKGAGNYTDVHFMKETPFRQCGNLKEWEENRDVMDAGYFVRVHDSYMLNYTNVQSYDTHFAVMDDNNKTQIPLSEEGFKKLYSKFSEKNSSAFSAPVSIVPLFLPSKRDFRNDEEE